MKLKLKIFILLTMLFMLPTSYQASSLSADECNILIEELNAKGVKTDDMSCTEAQLEYNYATEGESNNFSQTIASGFLSNNDEVKASEKKEYYYKYYLESHLVPFASGVDDELFKMDSVDNLVTTVLTLFSDLLGIINFLATTVIMFLTSIWQNNALVTLVDYLLVFVNESVLQIETLTGSGMVLFGSFALIMLIRNAFIMIKQGRAPLEYLKLICLTLLLIGIIPLSYTEIRPELNKYSRQITSSITSGVFTEDTKNAEIQIKEDIFNAVAFNGFMIKNFGAVSLEELQERDNIPSDKAKTRVEGVLNGNEKALKDEKDIYKSEFLSINIASAIGQLIVTFLWTIHSILTTIVMSIPLILLVLTSIVETITWNLIWIPLLLLVFKVEDGYISSFLLNRSQFLVTFIILKFTFSFLLKTILIMTNIMSGLNLGFLIITDIVILILFYFVWSMKDHFIRIILDLLKNVPNVALGRKSTSDMYNVIKPELMEIKKIASETLKINKIESETESPSSTTNEEPNNETNGTGEVEVENEEGLNERDIEVDNDNETIESNERLDDHELVEIDYDSDDEDNDYDSDDDYNNFDNLYFDFDNEDDDFHNEDDDFYNEDDLNDELDDEDNNSSDELDDELDDEDNN
ncbi:hypothetical protein RZE82_07070 [Mollicutes bacterium LVI A0039]|nr:hypothetical protein RZE82_07070 [Mollicutes bacterium LVI A0039]